MDRCIHDLFLHIYILERLICIYIYIHIHLHIHLVYLRPGTFETSTREDRKQPAKHLEISRSTLLWKWKIPTAQIQRLGFSKKSPQMNQGLGSMSPQNHEE